MSEAARAAVAVLLTFGAAVDIAAAQTGPGAPSACDDAARGHGTLQELPQLAGRLKDAQPNEGVPAFVAWLTAHQLGVIDDQRLTAQFDVQQRDVFYVTARMELAVLQRLAGAEFTDVTARIAASPSPAASIFSTLEAEVSGRCR